jgi:hypothetical protein
VLPGSSGPPSSLFRLLIVAALAACARTAAAPETLSAEVAPAEPFAGAACAEALPSWSSWTVRETIGRGDVALVRATRFDVEAADSSTHTWVTRAIDGTGQVLAAWQRHTGPCRSLQLGAREPGDPSVERERLSFAHDGTTWEGWRYRWPDTEDPRVDEHRLYFADARPGPPLRTERLRDGEIVAFTELLGLEVPDTLPTPFTAEQIRDAMPVGTRLDLRTISDAGLSTTRMEVMQADAVAASIRMTPVDAQGQPTGPSTEDASFWTDLRDHARFVHPAADRRRASFRTADGLYEGWQYTVPVPPTATAPGGVEVYLFADELPGPPLSWSEVRGGRTVRQSEQRNRTRPR